MFTHAYSVLGVGGEWEEDEGWAEQRGGEAETQGERSRRSSEAESGGSQSSQLCRIQI